MTLKFPAGRSTTRSKRKEREPTVESLASVTRSATSKRTAAAANTKAKKPPAKKKKVSSNESDMKANFPHAAFPANQ